MLKPCHRPLCSALTSILLAPPPTRRCVSMNRVTRALLIMNAVNYTCSSMSDNIFICRCPQGSSACIGDLHGLLSARQLSRSTSQLSTSQTSTAGMAEGASLIPMAGWFPQGLINPQNGAPSPTHFSRSARDWLITTRSPANPVRQRPSARRLRSGARFSHWVSCANPTRYLRFLVLGHTSQLQVHRSPRRHWLADWVGERASASAMACRSIANRKGNLLMDG